MAAVTVAVGVDTTSSPTNVVEDSAGTLWFVRATLGVIYYSTDDGATWNTSTTTLTALPTGLWNDGQGPPRLICTAADEFVITDGYQVQVYELATATTWTHRYTTSASVTSLDAGGAVAYDIDAGHIGVVRLSAQIVSGGDDPIYSYVTSIDRAAWTAAFDGTGTPKQHAKSPNAYYGPQVAVQQTPDYGSARPAKVLLVFADYRGYSFYVLGTYDAATAAWSWGGLQLTGLFTPSSSSASVGAHCHLVYNPRLGKALLAQIPGRDGKKLQVAEYDFAADTWTNLSHPYDAAPMADGYEFDDDYNSTHDVRVGCGHDNDDNVHVVVYSQSGSNGRIHHDTYDRAAGTWTQDFHVAAGALTAGRFAFDYLSPTSNQIRWAYIDGGNLKYDALVFNRPPTAATLKDPIGGVVRDAAAAITFAATFNDPDIADTLAAFAFRVSTDGGATYTYWDGAALVATKQWVAPGSTVNSGGDFSFQLPAGSLVNGNTALWSMDVRDASGEESGFAADASFFTGQPPTATPTAPVDPVTNATRPATSWTYNSPDARAQKTYQVRYITQAVYQAAGFDPATAAAVWDSGVIASASTGPIIPAVDLLNGVTYRSYVQVSDAADGFSAWAHIQFTMNLTPPEPAVLTVTVDNPRGRALLTAAGGHTPAEWSTDVARFERLDPDGVWRIVLGGAAVDYDATPEAAMYDEEVTPGFQHSWRVTTAGNNGAGSTIDSDVSAAVQATVASTRDMVKDPYDWGASVAVDIVGLDPVDPGADAVFQPLNRSDAVVVSDAARDVAASIVFQTETHAARDQLRGLLDRRRTLLLQLAADDAAEAGDVWWVRFHGDRPRVRLHPTRIAFRRLTQSFVEQPRPEDVDA